MHFMHAHAGWRVTFLEEDLKTPLGRALVFQDVAKVIDLAQRGGADRMSADKEALRYAIEMGRGSVWLHLSADQYRKLL